MASGERTVRAAGWIVVALAWASILAGPAGRAVAAPSRPPASSGSDAGEEAGAPAINPDAVSHFVSRTYKISAKKLWEGLLKVLADNGYPPEEVDQKKRTVKTSFIDFKATDYSEEVGDAQPRISATYTILQMRRVKVGKVSLEARVSSGDEGTDLSIRARILVQGLDRKQNVLLLTDRRSSGVIEADFLAVLEDTLALKRL